MEKDDYMAKWHPGRDLYFDWHGNPVGRERFLELFTGDRTVAKTDLGPRGVVSTIFMPMDMGLSWAGMPPLLFETMIFGGVLDGGMDRYATLAQARRGHALWVHLVKSSRRRPLIHNGGKP